MLPIFKYVHTSLVTTNYKIFIMFILVITLNNWYKDNIENENHCVICLYDIWYVKEQSYTSSLTSIQNISSHCRTNMECISTTCFVQQRKTEKKNEWCSWSFSSFQVEMPMHLVDFLDVFWHSKDVLM